MNRDHVGMIFKFLPKEEQEELLKLKPEKREFYNKSCRELQWEQDKDYLKFDDSNAYRPKGFLSWNEIHEDFDRKYLGKRIRQLVSEYPSTHSFVHKEWLYQNRIRYTNSGLTPNYAYPDLSRPDYGFEIVE